MRELGCYFPPVLRAVFHVMLERENIVLYEHQLYCEIGERREGVRKRKKALNFLDRKGNIGVDFVVLIFSRPKKLRATFSLLSSS